MPTCTRSSRARIIAAPGSLFGRPSTDSAASTTDRQAQYLLCVGASSWKNACVVLLEA